MANGIRNGSGQGLLGGAFDSPLFNLGIGLLANSGPSTTPRSFGQSLGQGLQFAQGAQQQSLRNQLVRGRLEDDSRRRSASQQLQGLLGDSDPRLGLLSQIAPNAVAQGLIGQQFPRQSALQRNATALGIDLESLPDAQKQQLLGGGASKQLDAALKLIELQNLQRGTKEKITQTQQKKAGAGLTVRGNLDKVQELKTLNARRREFFNDPTLALTDPIGALNTQQRFNQLTTELVLKGALDPLKAQVGTSLTDAGRRALFQSKITSTTSPDVTDQILADMEKGLNEAAGVLAIDLNKVAESNAPQSPPQQPNIFSPATLPRNKRQLKKGDILNDPVRGTLEWTGRNFRVVR